MKNRKRGRFWTSTDLSLGRGEILIFLYILYLLVYFLYAKVCSGEGIDVVVILSFHTDNLS